MLAHRAFGELRRLGLPPAVEAAVRRSLSRETGMLVVDQVVPGGPAVGLLQPGDILLALSRAKGPPSSSVPAAMFTDATSACRLVG